MQIQYSAILPAGEGIVVELLTREERERTALAVPAAEFSGAANSLLLLHAERRLYVGLGEAAKVTARTVRTACGAAAKTLQARGRTGATLMLGRWTGFAREAVEGALLGTYRFDAFQPSKAGEPPRSTLANLLVVADLTAVSSHDLESITRLGQTGQIAAEAANYARQIANQPGNLFFPATLADEAVRLAAESEERLKVEILDEHELRERGFGGLLAVGGGSARPPRLVILRYEGGAPGEAPLAFVGKAITFDSGGISIKPAQGMEEMVWDKCGGIAVLGAMQGVVKLRPPRNIVGIIASAENMTGPGAYRPGDIVTVYDGRQIEINNTDAEGRVVLADALGYARKDCQAAAIVDLATLTGACVVALGDWAAGMWTTDDALQNRLLTACETSGERLWPMPLYPEYSEQIKSDVALIKNSSGRPGGACTAAAFLRTFVEDTPWAHLDIAGPAAITKDRADLARGATGFGVRALLELAMANE